MNNYFSILPLVYSTRYIFVIVALVFTVSHFGLAVPAKTPAASAALRDFVHPAVNFEPSLDYGPEIRAYQGIPGIERAPGGRLWAVWYAGPEDEDRYNYVCMATSGDGGQTWSEVVTVIDPDGRGPKRASDPCLWLDPTGRLWLFWWLNGPGELASVTMAMTTDDPDSARPVWSKPRVIGNGVMMNKPIVSSNGEWLLPTAMWHQDYSCRVLVSNDQGESWFLHGEMNVPIARRDCDEPMLVERQDGSLWQLVRTKHGIGRGISKDGGRTWSEAEDYLADATSRFFIRRLQSGNLLLVKHGPLNQRIGRSHLTAYLSENDGETWIGGLILDERATVSYPDGTQSPDGTIFIIYDWNRADEKQILLAKFTEEDVLAGAGVSSQYRTRVLVNQAKAINPKSRFRDLRFGGLSNNEDGVPFLEGPVPGIVPEQGEIRNIIGTALIHPIRGQHSGYVQPGLAIFNDRPYVFNTPFCPMNLATHVPEMLNRSFVYSSIDGSAVTVTKPGMIYALTPSPARNSDSQEAALLEQGFEKVRMREMVLFLMGSADPGPGFLPGRLTEAVTIYQKAAEKGERIEIGKWGILVF
jgi:hypothetical protein